VRLAELGEPGLQGVQVRIDLLTVVTTPDLVESQHLGR
jgi:hypothetical protein